MTLDNTAQQEANGSDQRIHEGAILDPDHWVCLGCGMGMPDVTPHRGARDGWLYMGTDIVAIQPGCTHGAEVGVGCAGGVALAEDVQQGRRGHVLAPSLAHAELAGVALAGGAAVPANVFHKVKIPAPDMAGA